MRAPRKHFHAYPEGPGFGQAGERPGNSGERPALRDGRYGQDGPAGAPVPPQRRRSALPGQVWDRRPRRTWLRSHRQGLTLIEVMIASVILVLIMGSLFITLRTAMEAHREGILSGRRLQTLRYVTDAVARDMRSIYFQPSYQYNREYERILQERRRLEEERLLTGLPAEADNPGWNDPLAINPLDFMHRIDLAFRGRSNGFSFVRYQPSQGDMATQPWGLARISYEFRSGDNTLVRTEESVLTERIGSSDPGYQTAILDTTKLVEVMADNVQHFEIKYGFFYDGEWLESSDWNSSARRRRNPPVDVGMSGEYDPEDPVIRNLMTFNNTMPPDDLPTYVDLRITVGERPSGRGASTRQPAGAVPAVATDQQGSDMRTLRQLIWLPASEEAFIPLPQHVRDTGYLRRDPLE